MLRKVYGNKRYIPKGMRTTWVCVSEDVYQESKRIMKGQGFAIMKRMGQILEEALKEYNKTWTKSA